MSKNTILVFVATYNEKQNISDLFHNIIKVSPEYDVLIIDDNSNDGTKKSLEKLTATYSCLTVIHRPRKMGVGSAHRAAMVYALKNEYEELVTMDADFSHSPSTIPQMLEKLKTSDFKSLTRTTTLTYPTKKWQIVYETALHLLTKEINTSKKFRLIGLGLSKLGKNEEADPPNILDLGL